MPASKGYILICSEKKSFAVSCLSFLGVHTLRKKFFRLASASFFALNKSANTNCCTCLQSQCRTGNLTVTLLWKVQSRLWTPSPVSLLLGFLPFLVLVSLWSWSMRTHCIHYQVPTPFLALSWPHPLDSNEPIVCATSWHCQSSRCWNSSWILDCCSVSKTNYFLVFHPSSLQKFHGAIFFLESETTPPLCASWDWE